MGLFLCLFLFFFSKKLNEKNLIFSHKISIFTQKIKEYMVAYPTIKNYSIENNIAERFDDINMETENSKFEADYALTLANNVGQLLSWFMQFIGVGFGLMLSIKGEIMIGTVIAAQAFAGDLALPLQNIIININSIRSVKEIVRKLGKVSKPGDTVMDENISEHYFICDKYDKKWDVVFKDLFLEIDKKTIIDHFSFTFESGKKYLVVGVNGSGKSSVFKALKKWFKGCEGEIFINDKDIAAMEDYELSQIVSYLNESVSVFSGSVKENILLFRDIQNTRFEEAVSEAHVELELDKLIHDEGRNISSGEQRRIEIARSLITSVKFLVFDEVVSTLDIETAYEIEKLALEFKEKTVVFISHNFSGKLIREYDEILVMENGKLLSHGKYDDLIKKCPYFKRICDIKFGDI